MSEDGQPVKVWRKCHPVLPLPRSCYSSHSPPLASLPTASLSQAWWPKTALQESYLPWGVASCLGRSGAPWIQQEPGPREPRPRARAGGLPSGRQVAAPTQVGVGPRRQVLAERLLTFSRWRFRLSYGAAAASDPPTSRGGAGARPRPGR